MSRLTIVLSAIMLICGCSKEAYHTNLGTAEGTTYRIIYQYNHSIQSSIDSLLNEFENEFSIYRTESSISRFNRGERMVATERMRECIEISRKINSLSEIGRAHV